MYGGKRVSDRKKRRMPCELVVGRSRHNGLVLDLSPTGLFVQTTAKTKPGQQIRLVLASNEHDAMELSVEVVRKKVVPARLLALAQGGVGVRIQNAPEPYFQLLEGLGICAPSSEPEAEPEEPAGARFRVRVSQVSGPRSRRVDVAADDAKAAHTAALAAVGEGWKVLNVEPL